MWHSDSEKINNTSWPTARKLVKFVIVGASGVAVNTALLFVLHELANLPLLLASVLAVEGAIANNFFWNDRWTFSPRPDTLARFFKFNLVSVGGLAITTGVLYALVNLFGTHYLIANLAGISLATAWNFVLNLIWTWG